MFNRLIDFIDRWFEVWIVVIAIITGVWVFYRVIEFLIVQQMYRLKLHRKYYGGVELYFSTKDAAEKYMKEQIPLEIWHKVEIKFLMDS